MLLGTIESLWLDTTTFALPWNIDVVPMMLFYYSIGFYIKQKEHEIKKKPILIFAVVVVILSIISGYLNGNVYVFDLKKAEYSNMVLNIVYPVAYFTVLESISKLLSKIKMVRFLMEYIGCNTICIMFLHIPINAFMMSRVTYSPILFLMIGVSIPLVIKFCGTRCAQLINNKGIIKFIDIL